MLQWIRTRSRRDLILAIVVAGGFFLGIGAFIMRSNDGGRHVHVREHEVRHVERSYSGGVAFDQSFDVASRGRLEIHVSDLDVAVSDGSGDARVILRADDDEVPSDVLEEIGFVVQAWDDRLTIRTEDDDWGWDDDYDLGLEVTVPSGFDVFVQTGDGDVAVGSFNGDVQIQTGDGDVAVGPAGGSILRVQTGDGDVALAGARGRQVQINTGDGDVAAATLSADEITIRTGDGDVRIQDLSGRLEATTGDGDIDVFVTEFAGLEIRSGDGDITVAAPVGISADVRFSGSDFFIAEAFALPVRLDSRSVEGVLNGGGPTLSIRVGDGTIRLIEK